MSRAEQITCSSPSPLAGEGRISGRGTSPRNLGEGYYSRYSFPGLLRRLTTHNDARTFIGFTLAEVLITLGIIGVVAAMTIPTLMKNVQDIYYKTAYKKAYSVLWQAVNIANVNNELTSASNTVDVRNNFLTIMSKFKVVKGCTSGGDNQNCWDNMGEMLLAGGDLWPQNTEYAFIDSSGMAWSQVWYGGPSIIVDTNGFNKPNQWGKDRFYFTLNDKNGVMSVPMDIPVKIGLLPDNYGTACHGTNKCTTELNYYGTSWLYN